MENNIDINRMSRIHERYENKIDPELNKRIKQRIEEMYREDLTRKKEEEQLERLTTIDQRIEEAGLNTRQTKRNWKYSERKRKVQLYKRAIALVVGGAVTATVLVKTPIGGKIVEFSETKIENMKEDYEQYKLNREKEEYYNSNMEESVYESTGQTIQEIMEKGRHVK